MCDYCYNGLIGDDDRTGEPIYCEACTEGLDKAMTQTADWGSGYLESMLRLGTPPQGSWQERMLAELSAGVERCQRRHAELEAKYDALGGHRATMLGQGLITEAELFAQAEAVALSPGA